MVAKLYRTPDQDSGSNTLLTTSASFPDGELLTSDGYNMFALSDNSGPSADHASSVTWAQILGTAQIFDAEIEVTAVAVAGVAPSGWVKKSGGGEGGGGSSAADSATAVAGANHDNYGGGAQWYSNASYPAVSLKIDSSDTYNNNGTPNDWSDDIWATTANFSYEMSGQGLNDVLKGSTGNDRFSGAPGDDTFDGRGEAAVQNWYERESSGDTVSYGGNFARYVIAETTISYGGSDVAAYTVTDSLALAYGGDGVDTLINIERIEFADRVYNLKIRDISSDWDSYKTVVGTDGDDLTFIDFTDDKTNDSAATDSYSQTTWQLKGGAGNDVVVGGIENKINASDWMEGDTAIFGADSKYFDVSIEQVAFDDTSINWNNAGAVDSADTTLKDALEARFGGDEIARIVVEDTRDACRWRPRYRRTLRRRELTIWCVV